MTLSEENELRLDAARYRFLCKHPHWGFIETLCREFVGESPEEFKSGLDAAITRRWGEDEFNRIASGEE